MGIRHSYLLSALIAGAFVLTGCGDKPKDTTGGDAGTGTDTKQDDTPKKDGSGLEGSSNDAKTDGTGEANGNGDTKADPNAGLTELKVNLPKPAFKGTPKNVPAGVKLHPNTGKPRKAHFVPDDVKVISLKKPVDASDRDPIIGSLDLITDGDKEATEGSYVEFGPGQQWAQVDLGAKYEVFAVVFWFFHGDSGRVYHDVILQISDDKDFIEPKTVFNNDHDNSAGMGVGKDYEFFELYEGTLAPTTKKDDPKTGTTGRYVRLYVNGSTADELARYTEIEIWGRPAK